MDDRDQELKDMLSGALNKVDFPYNDNYWQAASGMLEQPQRTSFIWWGLGMFLLTTLSATMTFLLFNEGDHNMLGIASAQNSYALTEAKSEAETKSSSKATSQLRKTSVDKTSTQAVFSTAFTSQIQEQPKSTNSIVETSNDGIDSVQEMSGVMNTETKVRPRPTPGLTNGSQTNSEVSKPGLLSSLFSSKASGNLFSGTAQNRNAQGNLFSRTNMESIGLRAFSNFHRNVPNLAEPDSLFIPKWKPAIPLFFSLSVYSGLSLVKSDLKTTDPGLADYIQNRQAGESEFISWDFGAALKVNYNRFVFQTGLERTQYGEDFSYDFPVVTSTVNTSVEDNSYWDYDTTWNSPGGGGFFIVDSSYVEDFDTTFTTVMDTGSTGVNGSNRITYFEVPLLAAYRFDFGRIGVEVGGGALVGFLSQAKATLPHPEWTGTELTAGDAYRKTRWSYQGQIEISYQLDEKFTVFIQPVIRRSLQSTLRRPEEVDARYNTYRLWGGLGYRF